MQVGTQADGSALEATHTYTQAQTHTPLGAQNAPGPRLEQLEFGFWVSLGPTEGSQTQAALFVIGRPSCALVAA